MNKANLGDEGPLTTLQEAANIKEHHLGTDIASVCRVQMRPVHASSSCPKNTSVAVQPAICESLN